MEKDAVYKETVQPAKPRLVPSVRFTLAVLCFFGCIVVYSHRTDLSFSIVCMVNATSSLNATASRSKCVQDEIKSELDAPAVPKVVGEFDWSNEEKGYVLSSFFWGYLCSQIIGGYAAAHFGGKRVILGIIFFSSVITLLSPIAARTHIWSLIILRVVIGFLQGGIFPAMHTMWSVWAPPLERSVLTGVSYAGAQIGNVIVMPLSGFLCEHGFDGGWPSIYYILGGLGIAWSVLWLLIVGDRPGTHKGISSEERTYIEHSLEESMGKGPHKVRHPPWPKILTSRAVWAIYIGHFAGDWGAYTMMVSMPSFLSDVLGFDLQSLGFVAALPYVAYFAMINVGGGAADWFRHKGIFSTVATRRLAMLVALVGQAIFLVLSGYCQCGQEILVIMFITIGTGISGLQYAGFVVNYLDIAPAYSGTILGVGNTLSCIAGIFSPIITSWLAPDGTREQWQQVLWLTAAVLTIGAVLFSLMAKGEVEEWAKNADEPSEEAAIPLQEKKELEN